MPANMKKSGMSYEHGGSPVYNKMGVRVPGMVTAQGGHEMPQPPTEMTARQKATESLPDRKTQWDTPVPPMQDSIPPAPMDPINSHMQGQTMPPVPEMTGQSMPPVPEMTGQSAIPQRVPDMQGQLRAKTQQGPPTSTMAAPTGEMEGDTTKLPPSRIVDPNRRRGGSWGPNGIL